MNILVRQHTKSLLQVKDEIIFQKEVKSHKEWGSTPDGYSERIDELLLASYNILASKMCIIAGIQVQCYAATCILINQLTRFAKKSLSPPINFEDMLVLAEFTRESLPSFST